MIVYILIKDCELDTSYKKGKEICVVTYSKDDIYVLQLEQIEQ